MKKDLFSGYKPELRITRMLVGHKYLANRGQPFHKMGKTPNNIVDMAELAARRVHYEQTSKYIPGSADCHVMYDDAGYVVTFAWVEWEPTIVRHTKNSTELGHLSAKDDLALYGFGLSRNQLHVILDMASIIISDDDWREKMGSEITMAQEEFDILYQAVEKELAILEDRTLGGE